VNRMNYVRVDDRNLVVQSGYGPDHDVVPLLSEPGFYLGGTGEYDRDKGKIRDAETGDLSARVPLGLSFDKTTVEADGEDLITMTGLPEGASVAISGPVVHDFVHGGGLLEIAFSVPGTYAVEIEAFPNARTSYTVEAT
jgi:hypothetical protein